MKLRSTANLVGTLGAGVFLGVVSWTAVHAIIADIGGGQRSVLSAAEVRGQLPSGAGPTAGPTVSSSVAPTSTPRTTAPSATVAPPKPHSSAAPVPTTSSDGTALPETSETESTHGSTTHGTPSSTPTHSAKSTSSHSSSQGPSPTPTPTATAPSGSSKTFAVTGGTVGATCRGSSISLDYASPRDGWQVHVDNRGPEEIEVHFRVSGSSGTQDRAVQETESEVHVSCHGGTPTLDD